MRIKYLEMMLFILVSGATPSISVSSVAPNRALSRSTLLCNLSISTSYWKRRDVALLVTRHTLGRQFRQATGQRNREIVERQKEDDDDDDDDDSGDSGGSGNNNGSSSFSRDKIGVFVKRGTCYSHNGHVYIYVHMFVTTKSKENYKFLFDLLRQF